MFSRFEVLNRRCCAVDGGPGVRVAAGPGVWDFVAHGDDFGLWVIGGCERKGEDAEGVVRVPFMEVLGHTMAQPAMICRREE